MNIQAFTMGVATAFFAIFSVHILCFRRERTRYQTVLGIIMAIWALWTAKDMTTTFPGMYTPRVLQWILIIDGWSAIAYTILVMEAVSPGWTTLRRIVWTAMPFALFTAAYAIWPGKPVLYGYVAFLWIYAWTVVIVAWIRTKRYLRFLLNNYSNIEDIDVSWLRPVFVFAIVSQLAWLFTSLYSTTVGDSVYYMLTIVLWLIVLYYGWNFHPISIEKGITGRYEDGLTDTSLVAGLVQYKKLPPLDDKKLRSIMDERQLYLNPDLTLAMLAKELGTNRTYMSNWLRDVYKQTFYNYINGLRIERVSLPLLQQHPEYTIEYIAEKSGFGSVSTFRRAFLKYTGHTPQAFKAGSNPAP